MRRYGRRGQCRGNQLRLGRCNRPERDEKGHEATRQPFLSRWGRCRGAGAYRRGARRYPPAGWVPEAAPDDEVPAAEAPDDEEPDDVAPDDEPEVPGVEPFGPDGVDGLVGDGGVVVVVDGV